MITPFYDNGKLAFHLGLIFNQNGESKIITNIPAEILEMNSFELSILSQEQSIVNRSPTEYLNAVAAIIKDDIRAHFFFYYKIFDLPELFINESISAILNYRSDEIIINEKYYSAKHEPFNFYILCKVYLLAKLFEPKLFRDNVVEITRSQFEKFILNKGIGPMYFELYAVANKFEIVDDKEHHLYVMLENEIPLLILIQNVRDFH